MTEREKILTGYFYWVANRAQVKTVVQSLQANGFSESTELQSSVRGIKALADKSGNQVNFHYDRENNENVVAGSIGAIPVVLEGSKEMTPLDEYNSEYLDYLEELTAELRKKEPAKNKALMVVPPSSSTS